MCSVAWACSNLWNDDVRREYGVRSRRGLSWERKIVGFTPRDCGTEWAGSKESMATKNAAFKFEELGCGRSRGWENAEAET